MNETLYRFFLRHNNIPSEGERVAIAAFEEQLKDQAWRPSNPHLGGFMQIIDLGLLIHVLEEATNVSSRVARVVAGLVGERGADLDTIAELHVGALLAKLGAEVTYLSPTPGMRAPDISVRCGDVRVDVEVVRGDQRHEHQQHQRMLDILTQAISTPQGASYGVFVACELEHDVMERIVDAVLATAPGHRTEVTGSWCVVAGAADEGDKFVGGDFQSLAPDWWERDGPSIHTISRMIGPFTPAVHICTKVPLASYLNPVRRKAERPQRTGDHPYLVALDTSGMVGADRVIGELGGYLGLWPDVSGILLVFPFFAVLGPRTWRTWLIINPHAVKPITSISCLNKLSSHRVDISTGY